MTMANMLTFWMVVSNTNHNWLHGVLGTSTKISSRYSRRYWSLFQCDGKFLDAMHGAMLISSRCWLCVQAQTCQCVLPKTASGCGRHSYSPCSPCHAPLGTAWPFEVMFMRGAPTGWLGRFPFVCRDVGECHFACGAQCHALAKGTAECRVCIVLVQPHVYPIQHQPQSESS